MKKTLWLLSIALLVLATTALSTDRRITCTDSDGTNIWNAGYTTGVAEGGGVYMANDYCTGNVLHEQLCNGQTPITVEFNCQQKQAACETTPYGGRCA